MKTSDWRNEVRPVVRGLLAFCLYMKFGQGSKFAGVTPEQYYPIAEEFINKFEEDFKFEDRK